VTDDNAHLATRHFRLQVGGSFLTLPQQTLDPAIAGKSYSAQLTGPSGVTVTWLLYSGNLPPGLNLGSDGSITGIVDAKAGIRTYAFTVSAQDSQGDESLLAQAIAVQAPLVTAKGGCSTGGRELMPFGMLGLGLFLVRRRRTTVAEFLA
jgi:MYXO-CTERM domain-containing protein